MDAKLFVCVILGVAVISAYGSLQSGNSFASGVKLGSSAPCSTSTHKGTLQANANGDIQVCNGQTWETIVTDASTAADSNLLDGLDSSNFLRSNSDVSIPQEQRISHAGVNQWMSRIMTASGTSACEYDVANFVINSHHWSYASGMVVELFQQYYDDSGYSKWLVRAGYANTVEVSLLESYGGGRRAGEVLVGDRITMDTFSGGYVNYEIPLRVRVYYYSRFYVRITTLFNEVTVLAQPPDIRYNENPACNNVGELGSGWSDATYPSFHWGYHYFGKVGIGNSDPNTWGSYALYVAGSAYSTGTWTSSDERFKKDVTGIDNALDTVEKLQGRRFRWRREEFPEKGFREDDEVGFIAQEVESVLPELVIKSGKDEYRSVAYDRMGAVLVEAVKELRGEVRSLSTALSEQHEVVTALQAELRAEREARQRMEKVVEAMLQNGK